MMRALRSELIKLRRRGMLWGGLGTMVAVAALLAGLLFAAATPGNQVSASTRGPPSIGFSLLAKPSGMLASFPFAAQILGVVSLVIFAQNCGGEYSWGTLKVLLTREPRRLRLLAGKLAALALFVVVGVVLAAIATALATATVAAMRGIDTSQWWTADGLRIAGALILRVAFTCAVWGMMGAAIAIASRSAPLAIGVGIGYTIIAEPLLSALGRSSDAVRSVVKWLPGGAITIFLNGDDYGTTAAAASGTPVDADALTTTQAGLVLLVYGIAFAIVTGMILRRRDVST